MVRSMKPSTPQTPADDERAAGAVAERDVPGLVAALYEEAPVGLRQRLLNHLLRPVGPLALAAVAAGAFARLLPEGRWSSVQVRLDDVWTFGPEQVLDLAMYVQQKAPDMLWGLSDLLATNPIVLGTLSGVLLLAALRRARRARPAPR